jgi:CRISPR-associated endonuclease/helicase Cas3
VGTIDQALLSTLTVSHAHMRATALSRHLLVVDEVHASDAYMNKLLESVLEHHRAVGGSAFLMSATLGAEQRERFLHLETKAPRIPTLDEALEVPFPAVFHRPTDHGARCVAARAAGEPKRVSTERLARAGDPEWIAERALRAAADGARVLVLRNTVMDALVTQQALEEVAERKGREALLFVCAAAAGSDVPAPHHARFSRPDRVCLDRALEARYGKEAPQEGGCVVVTTQTAEQSLDLDADLLITDLCPMDVLLQRIGRLHRHRQRDPHRPPEYGQARVLVLVPEDRDLGIWIRKGGEARGPHGWGTVYEDLAVLEATWRTLEETPDFGIPEDNRRLVESAVHPEVLERVTQQGGGAWADHRTHRLGALSADLSTAALGLLKRDQQFGDATFPDRETSHRITTRLGADDRVALFEETERQARPPSLFDPEERVESLTIPESWSRGVPDDAVPEVLELRESGFDFRFGTRTFIYDRRGLRPLEGEGGRVP